MNASSHARDLLLAAGLLAGIACLALPLACVELLVRAAKARRA